MLLDIRQLEFHDLSQELVLESFEGDAEVDNGDLDVDFWKVMRVSHFGGYVQVEAIVVIHLVLAHSDKFAVVLLVDLLLEN